MHWFYSDGITKSGPLSEEAMLRLIRENTLNGETHVWNETLPVWQKLIFSSLAPHLRNSQQSPQPPALPIISTQAPQKRPADPANKKIKGKRHIKIWVSIGGIALIAACLCIPILEKYQTQQLEKIAELIGIDYEAAANNSQEKGEAAISPADQASNTTQEVLELMVKKGATSTMRANIYGKYFQFSNFSASDPSDTVLAVTRENEKKIIVIRLDKQIGVFSTLDEAAKFAKAPPREPKWLP